MTHDTTGNLYGTTKLGGTYGYGTVFKLDKTGKKTVLHTFGRADGAYPTTGMIPDEAGNLYGSTNNGGAFSYGSRTWDHPLGM